MKDPHGPVAEAPAGRFLGLADGPVERFRGIRYARAERYAAPAPVADATPATTVDARAAGPACPQNPSAVAALLAPHAAAPAQDEDCLRLSVTAPAGAAGDGGGRPVLVWVHGGAYTSGAADAAANDPARLVAEQDVVVVTVGYRLGVYGFLGEANLALLDIDRALAWTARNIAGFGGDPANITLAGQSAGADAVLGILAAVGAGALPLRVARAIVQSAPVGFIRGRSPMLAAMRDAAGPPPADAPTAEMLAAARRAEAAARGLGPQAAMPFGLAYGAPPLPPEEELDAAWRAVAGRVGLLIGRTAREPALFMADHPALRRVRRLPGGGRVFDALVSRYAERTYGLDGFLANWVAGGGRGYRYLLDWGGPGNPLRAAHTSDLPLLFGDRECWRGSALTSDVPWSRTHAEGAELRRIWADFARTGRIREPQRAAAFLQLGTF
ncbi:hypothetical protein CSPHI_09320 [Corynebacterium sphenisci DSM 44792]|uniref:Carboxylic ester hydrolase n=1 Tax=Corynebacterium sphenisci DSM 44792 TaxID=1437874 RepID=A0A1L7CZC3_9CORY|nr:carboxylesterase family protein [Corynebacterium sphenisci]APT91180.1 hypothetical protein CSPHI_09320 [Corynebacterium sphenisci DSM 44792]